MLQRERGPCGSCVCKEDDAQGLPGAAGEASNGTRTVSYTWLFKLFLKNPEPVASHSVDHESSTDNAHVCVNANEPNGPKTKEKKKK